jgi:hypothetical protein
MDLTADLFTQASNLPPDQREELAFRLLKSLPDFDDQEASLVFSDEGEAELVRRSERHRANPGVAVTAAEGLAELQSLVEGFAADDRADR